MIRIGALMLCLLSLTTSAYAGQAVKQEARIVKVADLPIGEIRTRPFLSSADTCILSTVDSIVWQIDSWVVGNELYKAYFDPTESCDSPYPYTIAEVNLPMSFAGVTDIYVSVDIETVNLSSPGCPFPGDLLSISSEYILTVPSPGLYSIWIPLDAPIEVNGPFFAGFFIGNTIDASVGAAVITDNTPVLCTGYNIWDTTTGFIDVNNNSLYNFPGKLAMFVSGIPGGSGGGGGSDPEPEPIVSIISHHFRDTLFTSAELWAHESSGSSIIDYVIFEYASGSNFIEIGRDYDGTSPLRNSVDPTISGDGYAVNWDFSSLTEGLYSIRATVFDTLGRSSNYTTSVYLEPTPPIPAYATLANGANLCQSTEIVYNCADENLPSISLFTKQSQSDFSSGLGVLYQFDMGDNNGNSFDGNLAANGEFGDYYSAPAAAALALKTWYDRGYTYLYNPPLTTFGEQLATVFKTRENLGTYDEDIYKSLYDYFLPRGAILKFDYKRNPDYFLLRQWLEYEERSVILGLGGQSGHWFALDGFDGWQLADSSFVIIVSDPFTSSKTALSLRTNLGNTEVLYNGNWRRLDIAISIRAKDWVISSTFAGSDNSGADGWSINWTPIDQTDQLRYFLHTTGIDLSNIKGTQTRLINYDCSSFYVKGDYDNNGNTNFVDLTYLIEFITKGGQPPVGGPLRADANCDNYVNVADIIYYLNFLFGSSPQPCR